jgi:hypothetical protein
MRHIPISSRGMARGKQKAALPLPEALRPRCACHAAERAADEMLDRRLVEAIRRPHYFRLRAKTVDSRRFLFQTGRHSGTELVSMRRCSGISMADWKADLNALVEETRALAKNDQVKATLPPAVVEPARLPPVHWIGGALRDEIEQRVARFKAHQQRLIRQRAEFAATAWKRVLASRPAAEEHHVPPEGKRPEGV